MDKSCYARGLACMRCALTPNIDDQLPELRNGEVTHACPAERQHHSPVSWGDAWDRQVRGVAPERLDWFVQSPPQVQGEGQLEPSRTKLHVNNAVTINTVVKNTDRKSVV